MLCDAMKLIQIVIEVYSYTCKYTPYRLQSYYNIIILCFVKVIGRYYLHNVNITVTMDAILENSSNRFCNVNNAVRYILCMFY